MAKTKQDFVNEGRADFLADKPRKGPRKATNSWQENAYDEGFNEALREKANTQADALGKPSHVVLSVTPVKITKADIPQAVIDHINSLHRQRATCTDERKRMRLLDKSIKLKNRWSKRAFAAHARAQ